MPIKLHKLLFYTLLLGVYGVFFSVESFYNFEGQTNARDILTYAAQMRAERQLGPNAQASPLHSTSLHGIRLNKRYHQEVIASCPVFSPARPEYALTPLTRLCYRPDGLPEPTLLFRPQRGPPSRG